MTGTCAKYRRISDDREGREVGITRQDEDLDELAARHRLTVVADYTDNDIGASTRSTKPRPGFKTLLADARAGRFDTIISYSSSRLTRRPRENEDLIELAERHGIRFVYVKSPSFDLATADGRRVARILAANDTAESEVIGERVARAARQRAESGRPHGGARRYGYQVDGITVAPAEAAVVAELTRRIVAGESTRGLAADLRERGVPTARGGSAWSARVVKEIVVRPRNTALRVANEDTPDERLYPASWPPIVQREQWQAARAILLDPARGTWLGGTPVSLLSGIAVCWCGASVQSGAHDTYVGDRRSGGCNHLKRSRTATDKPVNNYVLGFLAREQVKVPTVGKPSRRREVVDHAARIEAVRRQVEHLEDLLADDLLDDAAYRRQKQRKQTEMMKLEAAAVRSARPDVMAGVTVETWSTLALERRRAVIDFLCTVELHRKGTEGTDPETGVRIIPKDRRS